MELNGLSGNGKISRTFPTVVGRSYTLKWFDASNMNPICGVNPRSYRLKVEHSPDVNFDPAPITPASPADYVQRSYSILAGHKSYKFEFESRSGLPCGAIIDDVVFTEG